MSRRLVGFNLCLGVLSLVFAVAMGRELLHSRPLPGPPQVRPVAAGAPAQASPGPSRSEPDARAVGDASPSGDSPAAEVIASGNLFDPLRGTGGAAAEPAGPRPLLYGVVAGEGAKSRAYVEDPATKVVRGYQVGDTVAGWRLDQIRDDRVVIAGPGRGVLEVLLREPTKPRPALVASAAAVVTAAGQVVGPGVAETPRSEASSSPAAQHASPPDRMLGASPRDIGPIPSQLVRPARSRPSASQGMPARQEQ